MRQGCSNEKKFARLTHSEIWSVASLCAFRCCRHHHHSRVVLSGGRRSAGMFLPICASFLQPNSKVDSPTSSAKASSYQRKQSTPQIGQNRSLRRTGENGQLCNAGEGTSKLSHSGTTPTSATGVHRKRKRNSSKFNKFGLCSVTGSGSSHPPVLGSNRPPARTRSRNSELTAT